MLPTEFNSGVLKFFFSVFPFYMVQLFRHYEKASIKTQLIKARIRFLRDCLDEKVVPRSMNWIGRLKNDDSPFPVEACAYIKSSIKQLKFDCDQQYFRLRQIRRDLKANINDFYIWKDLENVVQQVSQFHLTKKQNSLQTILDKLIINSPWTKFSNVSNIVNLSNVKLSDFQMQLLGYGLNFSLPHQKRHLIDFVAQMEKDRRNTNEFERNFILMNMDMIFKHLKCDFDDFLPRRFRTALAELKVIKSIRISKSDKGGKVVIMDVKVYNSKLKSLLNNGEVYRKIKSNPLNIMQNKFNSGLNGIVKKYVKEFDTKFLNKFKSRLSTLPYLYGLPKIHKKDIPMRPIISNCNCPTYKLSKYLAKQLSMLLGQFSNAHLRNHLDLIESLKDVIPGNDRFISFDASSLFTNVPLKPTLNFLRKKISTNNIYGNIPVSTDCLIDLIQLCTKNMYFRFEDNFYEQIHGLAMGNPLSPVLACLFLEHIEMEKLPSYPGVGFRYWKRYVDDVLCLVPPDFRLDMFLDFLNSLYPTLKFTFEWQNNDRIAFLDVLIFNLKSCLKFTVYRKPTHSECYLHFFAFTPINIKRSIAQSLFFRAFRICSPEFLTAEIDHIFCSLRNLAYPERILNEALSKAKRSYYIGIGKINNKKQTRNHKFVVPYVPNLETFKPHLRKFNTDLTFRHCNKLSNQVICNKPKALFKTGVYTVPCKGCPQVYIGETGRKLETRITEHKRDIRKMKAESGIANHVMKFDHKFDFKNAHIVFDSNNLSVRHVVESALICHYTKRGLSINLNNGFSPQNQLLSHYIKSLVHDKG